MMRRIAVVALVVGCGGSKSAPPQRLQAGDIAYVGATVVPMDREGTLADTTVVVRGDRIALVAPAASIDTTGATIVDAKGKWIVPGLADMHVHTWSDRDFGLYLLNGVTTVRDMFGSPNHLTWRASIASGKLEGPTLFAAGPIVDGDPPVWPGSAVVTTPEAARQTVREQKQAGYDFIKVYNGLSAEVYDAILAEAKAQGIPVVGHVPKAVGIDKAIASGQLSIEHLDGYLPFGGEPHVDAAIVAATAKSGVWNTPTLVVMERFGRMDNPASLEKTAGLELVTPAVREQWNPQNDFRLKSWTAERFEATRQRNKIGGKLVVDLQKAGAKLVLGTDTGNPFVVPGFAVHDELALLVQAGLTPFQALRMATVAPAELVGTPGSFGSIAVGARADLLIVDGDPLLNLGVLAKPAVVVVRGKQHDRTALLAALEKAKPPADPLAALPPLELEGTKVATASYEVLMNKTVIGRERMLVGQLADGTHVVRGQAAYDTPSAVFQYRATPDKLEFLDGLTVTKTRSKVIATPKNGTPIELPVAADALIAPQTVAEYLWYADRLAKTAVGAETAITSAAVMVDATVQLLETSLRIKRVADQDGRRTYEVAGKVGDLDLTGRFSVDADGAPHEIAATVKWGTFVTRRVP